MTARKMTNLWLAGLVAAGLGFGTGEVRAAESLDAAVQEIADKFKASARTGDGKSPGAGTDVRRLAVTPFVLPDRRTTVFNNLLMIALTGKMIERADSGFRVIERAQLETALANLDMEGVPLFDATTASEIGKFLGVNTLIVGEINTLRDVVRIDARMIDIETIETMEQATTWVPLTPTVQEQLAADIVITQPIVQDGEGPDLRNGIWNGQGQCGDAVIGLALALVFNGDDTVTAMQTYYPVPNSPRGTVAGSLEMEGRFDPRTRELALTPATWLFQPQGHGALGIVGQMNIERGLIDGVYTGEHCPVSNVSLRRISR